MSTSEILSRQSNLAVDTDLLRTSSAFGGKAVPVSDNLYLSALDRCASNLDRGDKLAVYIHLPFCPTRCLSCERHAEVTHDSAVIEQYLSDLESELALTAARFESKQRLSQLHVGGGTPNYLSASQLAHVGAMVDRFFTVDDDTDASIECSPKRTTRSQLELMRGLGFKNISFEVREFDPQIQSAMGRTYSPELLQDACENARAVGFERVTIDLIYGLPDQRVASIHETLGHIVDLGPDRIHCKPFVRRGNMFPHQQLLDVQAMPSIAEKMSMFVAILQALEAADYQWVGVHGFAKSSDTLARAQKKGQLYRNYLGYSDQQIPWVLGFGIGAVTELPGLLVQNHIVLDNWHERLVAGVQPKWAGVKLSEAESADRAMLSQLCSNLSVSKSSNDSERAGDSLLDQLESNGLLEAQGNVVSLTQAGRVAMLQYVDTNLVDRRWSATG